MVHNTNRNLDTAHRMYKQQLHNQNVQQQIRNNHERLQEQFDKAQRKLREIRTNSYARTSSSSFDVGLLRLSAWWVAQCVVALIVLPIMVRTRSSSVARTIAKAIAGCFSILSAIACYCFDPSKPSLSSGGSLCSSSHKFSLDELGLAPVVQKPQLEPKKITTERVVSKIPDFSENLNSKTVSCSPTPSTEVPGKASRVFLERLNTESVTLQAKPIVITIKFRDQFFKAQMNPTFNGKVIKTTDKMYGAEGQKKIYTKMIEEIVKIHEPDYRESLGLIQGVTNEGFIFENGILPHGNKTTVLWKKLQEKVEKLEY
jgi:hypothetical protein